MTAFVIAVIAMFFLPCRLCRRGDGLDYADRDAALPLKGLFILLVTASHFAGYAKAPAAWDAAAYKAFQGFMRQMVVVPFLFFSGYGVFLSLRDKGERYLATFPVDRVLSVLFRFDLAVLPYFALAVFKNGHPVTAGWVAGGFTAWTSFGNSNWYIFTILSLYLFSYLSFLPFRRLERGVREVAALSVLAALVSLWICGMAAFKRPEVFYNTSLAYVAGSLFAACRDRFDAAFRGGAGYAVALALSMGVFLATRTHVPNLFYYEAASVAFAFAVLLVISRFRSRNMALAFCGRHLFAIYILQRLPMILLKGTALARNAYVYFAAVLAATLASAWVFDWLAGRAWELVRHGFRKGADR